MASVLMRVSTRVENPKYKEALQKLLDKVSAIPEKSSRQKKFYRDYHFANQGLF